jgi:chromosome segregation ATPase
MPKSQKKYDVPSWSDLRSENKRLRDEASLIAAGNATLAQKLRDILPSHTTGIPNAVKGYVNTVDALNRLFGTKSLAELVSVAKSTTEQVQQVLAEKDCVLHEMTKMGQATQEDMRHISELEEQLKEQLEELQGVIELNSLQDVRHAMEAKQRQQLESDLPALREEKEQLLTTIKCLRTNLRAEKAAMKHAQSGVSEAKHELAEARQKLLKSRLEAELVEAHIVKAKAEKDTIIADCEFLKRTAELDAKFTALNLDYEILDSHFKEQDLQIGMKGT